MPENYISKIKLPGDETVYDIRAHKTAGIYYAQVDSTSTSTNFTATIADLNIDAYYDGLTVLLYNGKVTSASGFTININGLGAKPSYSNMALGNPTTPTDPTRDTTIFNINYAMLFVYNSTRVSGGCWICYRGYDANTNTIGYQLRTNSYQLNTADAFRYYKILFTSADGTKWVPAASSTSNSATTKKTVNQRPINPFGEIVYCGSTTNYAANEAVSTTTIWQQYTVTLGYSFNRTGAALTLTTKHPVYVKCAPQSDGSAIIDADIPYVQTLPNEEDGKIYILLGMAYSATAIELLMNHPVYYYKDGAIRLWSNAAEAEGVTNIATGTGLTGGPITSSGTISHADTSTQASSTNSGRTYIQSVGLDDFGHVTSLSTGTEANQLDIKLLTTELNFEASTTGIPTSQVIGTAPLQVGDVVIGSNGAYGIVSTIDTSTNTFSTTASPYYQLNEPYITIGVNSNLSSALVGFNNFSPADQAITDPEQVVNCDSYEKAVQKPIQVTLFVFIAVLNITQGLLYYPSFTEDRIHWQILLPSPIPDGNGGMFQGVGGQLAYGDEGFYLSNFELITPTYVSAISTAINALDYTTTDLGANKTITSLTQTDGVIAASASNIAITSDQVTKYTTNATIATNDRLGIFDASDSNKLKGSSITFDTTETGTYLRRDGTWAAPPSGGSRVVYTAYFSDGEVGYASGTITLDDSKTGADIIADIESGEQVVIQIEDMESNIYEFTYSGSNNNGSHYTFIYVSNSNANFQVVLDVALSGIILKEGVFMELISNRVSSINSSSSSFTYPNTKTVYDAISGGAISHYKLSTMDIAVSANYQTITIDDIVGGFDCAVGDIVIGRNGNYGHIVTWSTSANPHSGTILYDGYLDDQIWSKSTSNGVYYPSVISSDDSNLANGSLTLFSGSASQAIGAKTGQASLNLQAYTGFNLSASHAAGSTSYTLNNATLGSGTDVSYLSNIYFYTAQHYTALKPTSVTASGTAATLVFSESLNPTSAVSQLYILNYDAGAFSILAGSGAYNAGYANVNVGTFISNTGHYSVVGGNKNSNGGQGNIIGGNRNKVTGHYDVVSGQSNLVTVSRALIGGLGHDTTNGPANVAAVGAYSSISSDTAFAVGIGTADDARANAFIVHTDGRATITTAPTANMDVANKSYVDDNITSHTHGNITNDGKIGTTANYAVYTTTGGALTASAALPTAITNATIAALPVWTATPTDMTYLIRQDTGGANSFGRVTFSTVNSYIKSKNPVLNYVTYDSTEDAIKFVFPS